LRLEAKVQTGPASDGTSNSFSNYTAECTGSDWTTTVNIHNPRPDSGRVTVAVLRNFHPRICLGFECLSEWCKGQSQTLQPALAARYSSNNFALAATLSKEALDVTCWRKLDHTVQLASSLIINQRTQHAVGAICYQWLFKNTCIKGMLHSDWSVGFNYTRYLSFEM
jgi:Eukaryotic porin